MLFGAVSGALQTALQEQLARDASAMPAFITGLRHYLNQPLRLKCLLQPCVSQEQPPAAEAAAQFSADLGACANGSHEAVAAAKVQEDSRRATGLGAAVGYATADAAVDQPAQNGAATGSALPATNHSTATGCEPTFPVELGMGEASGDGGSPCLLSLLTGIAPLRPALVDLLMDTMVAACQHARGGDRTAASCEDSSSTAHPSAIATTRESLADPRNDSRCCDASVLRNCMMAGPSGFVELRPEMV